jgi:hypothetical protein
LYPKSLICACQNRPNPATPSSRSFQAHTNPRCATPTMTCSLTRYIFNLTQGYPFAIPLVIELTCCCATTMKVYNPALACTAKDTWAVGFLRLSVYEYSSEPEIYNPSVGTFDQRRWSRLLRLLSIAHHGKVEKHQLW